MRASPQIGSDAGPAAAATLIQRIESATEAAFGRANDETRSNESTADAS